MEELGQKDHISVIFIPSDTAPTSVCVSEGRAGSRCQPGSCGIRWSWDAPGKPLEQVQGLQQGSELSIGKRFCFVLENCTDLTTGKQHFLLFVFPSWDFLCTNISGREGGVAPEDEQHTLAWDWWDSATLKVFSNLKSVIPRLF